MKKTVLIISGNNNGKTEFINKARQNDFWLWNFSAENRLSKLSYELGWSGDRSKKYYDWIKDFKTLANSYWDFEYKYYCNMIEKFLRSDKANLAIIHNAGLETVSKLKSKGFDSMYTLDISDGTEDAFTYDKTLSFVGGVFDEIQLSNLLNDMKEI